MTTMTVSLMDCPGVNEQDRRVLESSFEDNLCRAFGDLSAAQAAYEAYSKVSAELGEWPSDEATPEQAAICEAWMAAESGAIIKTFEEYGWSKIPSGAHFELRFWE